jgi:hypothetical protein
VGATGDGRQPNGIEESRLVAAIAGSSSRYNSRKVLTELRSMAKGGEPVERVPSSTPPHYQLETTAKGKQFRDELDRQADDDNWWERGKDGGDD